MNYNKLSSAVSEILSLQTKEDIINWDKMDTLRIIKEQTPMVKLDSITKEQFLENWNNIRKSGKING